MARLPPDVTRMILDQLDTKSLLAACQTNATFRVICNELTTWQYLWNKRHPGKERVLWDVDDVNDARRVYLSYDPAIRPRARVVDVKTLFYRGSKMWPTQITGGPLICDPRRTSKLSKFRLGDTGDQILPGDLIVGDNGVMWYVDDEMGCNSFTKLLPEVAFSRVYQMKTPYSYWNEPLKEVQPFWTPAKAVDPVDNQNRYVVFGNVMPRMFQFDPEYRLSTRQNLLPTFVTFTGDGRRPVFDDADPELIDFTASVRGNIVLDMAYAVAQAFADSYYDNCQAYMRPTIRRFITNMVSRTSFVYPLIGPGDLIQTWKGFLEADDFAFSQSTYDKLWDVLIDNFYESQKHQSLWSSFLTEMKTILENANIPDIEPTEEWVFEFLSDFSTLFSTGFQFRLFDPANTELFTSDVKRAMTKYILAEQTIPSGVAAENAFVEGVLGGGEEKWAEIYDRLIKFSMPDQRSERFIQRIINRFNDYTEDSPRKRFNPTVKELFETLDQAVKAGNPKKIPGSLVKIQTAAGRPHPQLFMIDPYGRFPTDLAVKIVGDPLPLSAAEQELKRLENNRQVVVDRLGDRRYREILAAAETKVDRFKQRQKDFLESVNNFEPLIRQWEAGLDLPDRRKWSSAEIYLLFNIYQSSTVEGINAIMDQNVLDEDGDFVAPYPNLVDFSNMIDTPFWDAVYQWTGGAGDDSERLMQGFFVPFEEREVPDMSTLEAMVRHLEESKVLNRVGIDAEPDDPRLLVLPRNQYKADVLIPLYRDLIQARRDQRRPHELSRLWQRLIQVDQDEGEDPGMPIIDEDDDDDDQVLGDDERREIARAMGFPNNLADLVAEEEQVWAAARNEEE